MSAKKKVTTPECTDCGSILLAKDSARHQDFCNKPFQHWEISLVRPKVGMKGLLSPVDKLTDYLHSNVTGWSRNHSIFVNPQTLDSLGATARQPVKLSCNSWEMVGTLWPCKELGVMRIACLSKNLPDAFDSLIQLDLVWEHTPICAFSLAVKQPINVGPAFVEYLETYLTNSYIEDEKTLSITFYGENLSVTPIIPLEVNLETLSLGDDQCSQKLYSVGTRCAITIESKNTEQPSTVDKLADLNSIVGMDSVKKLLLDNVVQPFQREGICCSVLMWGLPGSGKTLILKAVSKALGSSAMYFKSLDEFFDRGSLLNKKSIAILDLHTLEKEHKAFTMLSGLLEDENIPGVILSVRQAEDIDLGVRVRFPVECEIPVPTEVDRIQILQSQLPEVDDQTWVRDLSRRTHGFTGGDLHSLVKASRFAAGSNVYERIDNARKRIRPTGIRQFILEVPDVKFDDIGGNEELKLEIQQAVIWPQLHSESFKRFGIDPPTGILLYGPPGCSKTLIARALANESKMNFLAVKGPELFSKYVGDSEKAIRDLFARARQVAPTIVFFDEIDAVGASRGSDKSSGVSDRVLAQLLTELDGLVKSEKVILLAATNRPDQLDSALLRPGRLDRAIHVGLPSSSTREAIISLQTSKMALSEDVQIGNLVSQTEGYSGAELVAVCRQAAMIAMREDIQSTHVHGRHFTNSLQLVVPRTEKYLLDVYKDFQLGCN